MVTLTSSRDIFSKQNFLNIWTIFTTEWGWLGTWNPDGLRRQIPSPDRHVHLGARHQHPCRASGSSFLSSSSSCSCYNFYIDSCGSSRTGGSSCCSKVFALKFMLVIVFSRYNKGSFKKPESSTITQKNVWVVGTILS